MSEIEASGPKSRTTDLPPISQTYIALATLYPVAYTAASSTTDEGTHFAFGALALLVSLFIIGFALRYPLRLFLRRLRGRPRSESTQTETLGPIVIGILGLILFVAGAVQVGQGVAVRSQSEDVQQIGNVIEQVTLQEVQWYKNPSLTIPAGLSHYLAPPNEGGSDVQDLIGFVKKHLVDRNRRFAPDSSAVAFAPGQLHLNYDINMS